MWVYISYQIWRGFSHHFFKYFSISPSFSSFMDSDYKNVRSFVLVSQVSETVPFFSVYFSLYCSDWIVFLFYLLVTRFFCDPLHFCCLAHLLSFLFQLLYFFSFKFFLGSSLFGPFISLLRLLLLLLLFICFKCIQTFVIAFFLSMLI